MFRKTDPHEQLDLFTCPSSMMGKRAAKRYAYPSSWHNQFFSLVTSRIDEEPFRVLFPEGAKDGRPNASIRVLVAMSVLKEGFGCSDETLFERCEFDMLVRKALGLCNLDDELPALETWYLFRRRICRHNAQNGTDLMRLCFEQVTGSQVKQLNISGKSVRMDSKLIGSNIAKQSRYTLIHKTMVLFLKANALTRLPKNMIASAKEYMEEDSQKTVYRAASDTLTGRIKQMGQFIYSLLKRYEPTAVNYAMLKRLFEEQFNVVDGNANLKDKNDIPGNSLQSPYDEDATYRNKGDQKVSGMTTNITETIEPDKPSLIVSVQVEPATTADCHMFQEGIENAERVTCCTVENAYADGAYQSPDNREYCENHNNMQLKTCKMQGKRSRWDLTLREDGDLDVVDMQTGQTMVAIRAVPKKGGKTRWRIPCEHSKEGWRYFEEKELKATELRRQLDSLPLEEQHKRNNVEAAMFQYSFHTRKGKTRYRGLAKHRMHAYCRCMWMNMRRIMIFQSTTCQRTILEAKNAIFGLFIAAREALERILAQPRWFQQNPHFGWEPLRMAA